MIANSINKRLRVDLYSESLVRLDSLLVRSAQRRAPREINVDTVISTLTRRGRHYHHRLVTLRREKQCCFSTREPNTRTAGFEKFKVGLGYIIF